MAKPCTSFTVLSRAIDSVTPIQVFERLQVISHNGIRTCVRKNSEEKSEEEEED